MNLTALLDALEQMMRGYYTPLANKLIAILTAISTHVGASDNPHHVTKTQVGLAHVQDYPPATRTEAENGDSNTAYMTPQRTAQAIAVLASDIAGGAVGTHAANTSNPHQVTKTQVGLGSVQDYAIATEPQARVGTNSNTYMTPQRTLQQLDEQVFIPLAAVFNQAADDL